MFRISRIRRKSNLHSREKCLIALVLGTLCFICFGGIFLLPKYGIYKHFQETEPETVIPGPPIASDELAPHHGRDHYFMSNRQRLEQKIPAELSDIQEEPPGAIEALALAALMDRQHRVQERDSGVEDGQHAAIPKLAAHVQSGDDQIPAQQVHLPLGGGGNDQAPDSLNATLKQRREKVKEMMEHAWHNYKRFAWGNNELRPLSRLPHWGAFGTVDLGATIVDGLDTLYIMGLEKEYREGLDWIESEFSLDNINADLNVFEANIRFVGGMLTLYSFTGDPLYMGRAQQIADKLLPAFQSPTGIPYALVNTENGLTRNHDWASDDNSILAEFGTLHLEFTYLSDITGNPLYRERVQTIRKVLKEIEKPNGLYPNFINPKTGKWGEHHMSLGALGDSFYEYLLKAWLQSGQKDEEAREMFDEAMLAILREMVRTSPGGLVYVSELKFDRLENKMDHLACFSGGLLALGAATRQDDNTNRYMEVGEGITNTCHESYIRTPTQLGPEVFRFSKGREARAFRSQEKCYILRPEAVESYFVLWRLTHDQKYRDWGWEVVLALEKHCRTAHGYCGVRNVYQRVPKKDDVQQSYFLAETLKYLFLLFSDDSVLPLDKWVFNTEAHPLPIKGANAYYRQELEDSAGK